MTPYARQILGALGLFALFALFAIQAVHWARARAPRDLPWAVGRP